MIMLGLSEQDVRGFMDLLLRQETFDVFDTRTVTVQSIARFDIEGLITPTAVPDTTKGTGGAAADPAQDNGKPPAARVPSMYNKWRLLRPYVHNIIKGGGKPRYIKVIMSYPLERMTAEFPDAKVLFINITYENNRINIITGTSMKTFSLDKSVESLWDSFVKSFLNKTGLNFTEQETEA